MSYQTNHELPGEYLAAWFVMMLQIGILEILGISVQQLEDTANKVT